MDLMVATIEHRFEFVNRLPDPVEWLTINGSCCNKVHSAALWTINRSASTLRKPVRPR